MGVNDKRQPIMLFEPLELRGVTVPNRIMISPMCQYCAKDAVPTNWHFVHLGSRAVGGAGIVMTEAIAVEPEGRITPYDLGLWSDAQEAALAPIASFVNEQGAVPGIQLAHAGRKASHSRPWEDRRPLAPHEGGWEVVGPGALPWEREGLVPRALDAGEIALLVEKFRMAAERSRKAGFRLLEVHAAHGYLFHSFLSPLTNTRDDAFGGNFDGRSRFLLEAIRAIRTVWPSHLPLFVRLSATDWVEGGWKPADTIRLAGLLSALGVDAIDCSSGGIVPGIDMKASPGYQVPFAEAVRQEADIKTVAVGMISEHAMAEDIISSGKADLVAFGRLALWDPYWPHHAAGRLGAGVNLPIQYARADIFS